MSSSSDASNSANTPAPGRNGPALFRLVFWCLLTVVAPTLLLGRVLTGVGFKATAFRTFGDAAILDVSRAIADVRTEKPDYIGIGNSMLYTRLGRAPEALNALTGKKFHFIVKDGTASAAWYLTLKNVVAASGVKPKVVFFFIRDNDITSPKFRTAGRSALYLSSLRGKHEPQLDSILGTKSKGGSRIVNAVSDWLNGPTGVFTFRSWEDKLPDRLVEIAMDVGGAGAPKVAQRSALAERFAIENLRPDIAADMPSTSANTGVLDPVTELSRDYSDRAEDASFLPAMMDVAKTQGFKLLFFRVKRRPDKLTASTNDPPELRQYIRHLQQWIEKHGGLFFDESYDPSIKESDYLDGDHIRPERMEWYQQYFWKRMAGVLP